MSDKTTNVHEITEVAEKPKHFLARHKTKLVAAAIAVATASVFVAGRKTASVDVKIEDNESQD